MHLVRLLVFFAARYDFWFSAAHIQGRSNSQADAISRNHLDKFFTLAPHASPSPAAVTSPLLELVSHIVTWTSSSWVQLFNEATARSS